MQRMICTLLCLLVLLLAACDLITGDTDTPLATPTPATVTPEAVTPAPEVVPEEPTPPAAATETATLTVWIPPELVTRAGEGINVLSEQLAAFAAGQANVEVVVEQKSLSGPGSILNYLRNARIVAPRVLPDLVALPMEQLTAAATEELVYPLGDYVDPALFDDLYPAAQALAQPTGEITGYPFAVTNLTHLAYNPNIITETLSLNWDEFIAESPGNFIFPAAGREGAVLALQLYLAAGGLLTNEARQVRLQVEPLTAALQQLGQGRTDGFILLQSSNIVSLEESWQTFELGTTALVLTTADQFLHERTVGPPPGFAPIPGFEAPLPPLADGWAWALTTPDPARRRLAAELLAYLVSAPNLGDWSAQSLLVPARREAFAAWPDDAYLRFLQQELERAQLLPINPNSSAMVVLSDAVFDVVSLTKTPPTAAQDAAAALQP